MVEFNFNIFYGFLNTEKCFIFIVYKDNNEGGSVTS